MPPSAATTFASLDHRIPRNRPGLEPRDHGLVDARNELEHLLRHPESVSPALKKAADQAEPVEGVRIRTYEVEGVPRHAGTLASTAYRRPNSCVMHPT
jgi:hypothetical protein